MQEFYEDWLPHSVRARDVVERVKVPQSDYFGFGEKLAVVEQGTSDPLGMGFIYDRVALFLASDFKNVAALVGTDPLGETGSTEAAAAKPAVGPADKLDYVYDVFVSHDRSMPEFVLDFVHELKAELELRLGKTRERAPTHIERLEQERV